MTKNFNIAEWRRTVFQADLTATEKLVALALANNFSPGHPLYPSITTLAEQASLTERAVYKAIAVLKQKEIVSIEKKQIRKARILHNEYTLIFPKEESCTPELRSSIDTVQTPELRSQTPERTPELRSQTPELRSQTPELRSDNIDINIDINKVKKDITTAKAVSTTETNFFYLSDKKKDDIRKALDELSPVEKKLINKLKMEEADLKEFIGNCCSSGLKRANQQVRFMQEAVTYWGNIQQIMSDEYNTDISNTPTMHSLNIAFPVIKSFLLGRMEVA